MDQELMETHADKRPKIFATDAMTHHGPGGNGQSGLKRSPMTSMDELITMSDNFNDDCVSYMGYGTSGSMFYGETMSDQRLTFRKIEYHKHTPLSDVEFLNQVELLEKLKHKNILKFLGYSMRDGEQGKLRALLYEWAPNGSLDYVFHVKKDPVLSWSQRLNIAIDVARALEYLHRIPIVYRDLNSRNVLLFDDHNKAKIADLHVAHRDSKLTAVKPYHPVRSDLELYCDYDPHCYPSFEYGMESDVFRFGVLLLELLTGKKSFDRRRFNARSILFLVCNNLGKGKVREILDPRLNCPLDAAEKFAALGAYCVLPPPKCRPNMLFVIRALEVIRDGIDEEEIQRRVEDGKVKLGEGFVGSVAGAVQRAIEEEKDYIVKVMDLKDELISLPLDAEKEMHNAEIWLLNY